MALVVDNTCFVLGGLVALGMGMSRMTLRREKVDKGDAGMAIAMVVCPHVQGGRIVLAVDVVSSDRGC